MMKAGASAGLLRSGGENMIFNRVLRAIALALWLVLPAAAMAGGTVVNVPDDDAEMNAAVASARASLPSFFDQMAKPKPGEESFALKVRITDAGKAEHFWLVDISRQGDKLIGRINNDPEVVGNVVSGQNYEFSEADITDWMFMRNGRIVGNATMRPLLKRMPPEEAETYRNLLETP